MVASTRDRNHNLLGISVVIPCHNAAGTLDACLAAIGRSSVPVWECIVVDDASRDGTAEHAGALGAIVVRSPVRTGPARARNIGAEQATGEILLFLDADVAVHEDVVARIVEILKDTAVDAVFGAYDDTPAVQSFVSQYRNLLHCFTHRGVRRNVSTFWCACGAIRRELFLKRGGLPERYTRASIEDVEFGYHLAASGGAILLDPSIEVKHLKHWTFANMLRTDIFDRAVPWARLILRTRSMTNDLILTWKQRAAVGLASMALVAALAAQPFLCAACAVIAVALHYQFYVFLAANRGVWFAVRAVPLHLAFHLYSGFVSRSARWPIWRARRANEQSRRRALAGLAGHSGVAYLAWHALGACLPAADLAEQLQSLDRIDSVIASVVLFMGVGAQTPFAPA